MAVISFPSTECSAQRRLKKMCFKKSLYPLLMESSMGIMAQYLHTVRQAAGSHSRWKVPIFMMRSSKDSSPGCSSTCFQKLARLITRLNLRSNAAISRFIWNESVTFLMVSQSKNNLYQRRSKICRLRRTKAEGCTSKTPQKSMCLALRKCSKS